MITYNHELYISEAIEGVMMQRCNFEFELVIGEDFSTDNTLKICKESLKKYSSIRLISSDANVGMIENFIRTINACTGKYLAFCEGDDYWTERQKLQMQVEYLLQHKDCVLSFHNALTYAEYRPAPPTPFLKTMPSRISIEEFILKDWFVPTASIVCDYYRMTPFPKEAGSFPSLDLALLILLAANGLVHYVHQNMSVYRQTICGATHQIVRQGNTRIEHCNAFIRMLEALDATLGYKYHGLFRQRIMRTCHAQNYYKLRYNYQITPITLYGSLSMVFDRILKRNKIA